MIDILMYGPGIIQGAPPHVCAFHPTTERGRQRLSPANSGTWIDGVLYVDNKEDAESVSQDVIGEDFGVHVVW